MSMGLLEYVQLQDYQQVRAILDADSSKARLRTKDGLTALHYAAKLNDQELMDMLIQHGAIIDAQNHWGMTPLIYAAHHGKLEAVKLLTVKYGADETVAGLDLKTAYDWALVFRTVNPLLVRFFEVELPQTRKASLVAWHILIYQRFDLKPHLPERILVNMESMLVC